MHSTFVGKVCLDPVRQACHASHTAPCPQRFSCETTELQTGNVSVGVMTCRTAALAGGLVS